MSALPRTVQRPVEQSQTITALRTECRRLAAQLAYAERVIDDLHAENGLLRAVYRAAVTYETEERKGDSAAHFADYCRLRDACLTLAAEDRRARGEAEALAGPPSYLWRRLTAELRGAA